MNYYLRKLYAISSIIALFALSACVTTTTQKKGDPTQDPEEPWDAQPSPYSLKGLPAKSSPEYFKSAVIYQILVTHFTQDGTINKAAEMLPYIKSLGVDVVQLCPLVEQDDDMDRNFWSYRQKAAKTDNPKNPYRIKDFFKIEPDYGTSADVKAFVEKAHSLGLRVVFDLVYYHCGPKANIVSANPDFIIRDPDGKPHIGEWKFPRLNFKSKELREYLIQNMEYFVKEYDIDGYRMDVGAQIPADFWEQAAPRVRKLKPDFIMIEESGRAGALDTVYDAIYEVPWQRNTIKIFHEKKPAWLLRERHEIFSKRLPKGGRVLRAMENHDFANGPFRKRCEIRFGYRGMDAVQVMNFTMDGIPFIYSGNEFADDAPMTIFSNKKHGRYFLEWSNMRTEQGARRMELMKKLIALRDNPVFNSGETKWIDNDNRDFIISYARIEKTGDALIVINAGDKEEKTTVNFALQGAKELFNYGVKYEIKGDKTVLTLAPKGYLVLELKK